MKKRLLVNNKLLRESSIKVGDKDYQVRLRRRIVDLRRVADMAKAAATKAEEAGNTELAKKLNDRVEEIEKLLATYNMDTIDPEELETEDENVVKDDSEEDSDENDDFEDDDSEDDDSEDDDEKGSDEDEKDNTDKDNSEKNDNSESDNTNSKDNDTSVDNKENNNNKNDSIKDGPEKDIQKIPDGGDDDPRKDDEIELGGDTEDPNDGDDDDEDSTEGGSEINNNEDDDSDLENENIDDEFNGEDDSEEDENKTDSDNDENNSEDDDSDSEENNTNSKEKKSSSDDEYDSNNEDDGLEDEEETDDSPVNDPFADEEDIPDLNLGGGMQEPRDATLKDIIKQLKGLPAESKRGAIAALQDLLDNRKPKTESLTEAVKGVREMTDDEFGDYINSTYDLIDQVEPLQYEDEEELKKKKAKVGQWSTDPKTLKELEDEDNVSLEKDFRKEKAREKENSKYAKIGTLEDFKLNFYNAIKHQVEMVTQEYQSYDEINAEYESEDVIMKADLTQTIPEEVIPVIDVYFDVSGSWYPADIEIGKKAIATVKEFEDAGEIKLNIFYFSNGVSNTFESTRARYGTGTWGWPEILKNIKATEAQNIMIMTDADIEDVGNAKSGPTCKVDGCVWFLWRNGLSSPSCVSHLIGKQGNYQYAFYR